MRSNSLFTTPTRLCKRFARKYSTEGYSLLSTRGAQHLFVAVVLVLLVGLGPDLKRASADAEINEDSFVVTAETGSIVVEWETESEVDHAGFYIWRSTAAASQGDRVAYLPSLGGFDGAYYTWEDFAIQPRVTYYYRLESYNSDGTSKFYGPREITTGEIRPTPSPSATTSPLASATPTTAVTITSTATPTGAPGQATPTLSPTPTTAATPTLAPPTSPSPTPPVRSAPAGSTPTAEPPIITPSATPPRPGGPSPRPSSTGTGGSFTPTLTAPTTRPPLTTPGAAAHTDHMQRLPTVTPRAVATLVIALSQALPASTPVDLSRPAPVAPPRSAVDIVLLVLSSGLVLFGLAAAGGVVWFVLHEPRR